jgi:hypothetical protein
VWRRELFRQGKFAFSRAHLFAAKFTRQQTVIFHVDEPIPLPDVLPGPPLVAHSDFFEDAPRSMILRKMVGVDPMEL